MLKRKVIVTGTGRCGTTYLMRLFTRLKLDTGFNSDTMFKHTFKNCNSGLENTLDSPHEIVKNPSFLKQKNLNNVRLIIIPIRDFKDSGKSRERLGQNVPGGFTSTKFKNANDQINNDYIDFIEFIRNAAKYNINIIFLDFEKLNDPRYLYEKLQNLFMEKMISFDKNFIDIVTICKNESCKQ